MPKKSALEMQRAGVLMKSPVAPSALAPVEVLLAD